MTPTVLLDIEVYRNFFFAAFERQSDGRVVTFEKSDRSELDTERLKKVLMSHRVVTFNGATYDIPMTFLALEGATNEELKSASDRIIKGRIPWWEVERALEITIPRKLDHIDLFDANPSVKQGLKLLKGRLHDKRMQDLPYDEAAILTHEQMDEIIDYCVNSDLPGTRLLFKSLKEPLELRVALGAEYEEDFRSKSDAQIGEAIVKKRVEEKTGKRVKKAEVRPGSSFRYNVPDFIRFESPQMQEVLEKIRATEFIVDKDGKVDLPKFLKDLEIRIGNSVYSMGIGGLHSTESQRTIMSDDDYILIDADVASQYPSIMLKLGLFPAALGPAFLDVYSGIKVERVAAKRAGDKIKDKGLKIALNGVYGKTGSRYSVLYAPHLMISVTLTGQLTLLMLIERAEAAGIPVVSGNTDGVLFWCPREKFNGFVKDDEGRDTVRLAPSALADITDQWERETSFDLEFADYLSIHNASVNTYFAIKSDGSVKRKGTLANPWGAKPDLREQMMKNPAMTICSDAALAFIKDGTPIEETIRACRDIRQFVTVVNVRGGGTWRDKYLGKVVRYVWAHDGDPILYKDADPRTGNHKKVSKTDGCRPLMDMPDEFPDFLDIDHYVAEAKEILIEVGYAPAPPVVKKRRKKITDLELVVWGLTC